MTKSSDTLQAQLHFVTKTVKHRHWFISFIIPNIHPLVFKY